MCSSYLFSEAWLLSFFFLIKKKFMHNLTQHITKLHLYKSIIKETK